MRILLLLTMLSGCIVATRPGPVVERREVVERCPPKDHWEDGKCVHNHIHGHQDHDNKH